MKFILDWFDERTGYRSFVHEALYERIPGGARWRYVWGSTLCFTFATQMITGLFLWMAYSPSAQTAWESVYYIQHGMQFGWLLRGIHHFTAQAMIVLLALHLLQVVVDGAYRAPREINFWLGLILMLIVLGLSLTGYLLPWDQKGYWATQVATNIMGMTPGIGPEIQKLAVGGTVYGHHTLTRFFALHAGLLPALLIMFLVLHIYVFRRHGITTHPSQKPDSSFWPDQVLRDAVACLAVLAVVLFLVFLPWMQGKYQLADRGGYKHEPFDTQTFKHLASENRLGEVMGAELGAPADPADNYSAARPEWYFLFLFQFLKLFPGDMEVLGAMVIPGVVMGVLFLMPFIGRWKLGHRFNILYLGILLAGVGILTGLAIAEDRSNSEYQVAVEDAHVRARRIVELIQGPTGIDALGARGLLRSDPKLQGPRLFAKHCATCHRYDGHDGTGKAIETVQTASDLGQFGKRTWIRGFLAHPDGPQYYGPTTQGFFNGVPIRKQFTDDSAMVKWSRQHFKQMKNDEVDAVVEFLAAQADRSDVSPPDAGLVAKGRKLFEEGGDNGDRWQACSACHDMSIKGDKITSEGMAAAPDLTGYGSEEWMRRFLNEPDSKENYGKRNCMPSFKSRMTPEEHNILLHWMQHRWYEMPARIVEQNPAPEG